MHIFHTNSLPTYATGVGAGRRVFHVIIALQQSDSAGLRTISARMPRTPVATLKLAPRRKLNPLFW